MGRAFEIYRNKLPGKLLMITEFCNPIQGITERTKSDQYLEFYRMVRSQPGIAAAFSYALSADELGRRFATVSQDEKPRIQSPQDAANLVLYEMGALEQEHLRVLLLDTRNQVMQSVDVYKGSLNSSVIRVGEVFRVAVQRNAAAIIVAHNHPSGDPTPSPEDVAVTRAIVQAGKLLDIEVLDHLIVGKNRYVSLKSKGMGFNH